MFLNILYIDVIPAKETVSQFVIPAKPRETGREPGSRSPRDDVISLDSRLRGNDRKIGFISHQQRGYKNRSNSNVYLYTLVF